MDKTEAAEYRRLLVHAIHSCAVKFPAVAGSVVSVLMDFLNGDGALDVIVFVRELIETQPAMRSEVLSKLLDSLSDIRAGNVARTALWIAGEYADGMDDDAFKAVMGCLGPLPFHHEPQPGSGGAGDAAAAGGGAGGDKAPSRPAVELTTTVTILPDGTYATQTALTESTRVTDEDANSGPFLRKLVLDGDYFLGSVAVVALTKMALRARTADPAAFQRRAIDTLTLACGMLTAGESPQVPVSRRIDADSKGRIQTCIRSMLDPDARATLAPLLLGGTREVYTRSLASRKLETEALKRERDAEIKAQPFELIAFRQLRGKSALGASSEVDMDDDAQVALCVKGPGAGPGAGAGGGGGAAASSGRSVFVSKTNRNVNVHTATAAAGAAAAAGNKTGGGADSGAGAPRGTATGTIYALTGGTDPVYVEATVTIHDFDISLDFLVINRTDQTLTNVDIDLNVVGDLKVTEKHPPFSMAPRDQRTFTTSIKIHSTDSGFVFGTVSFDHPQHVGTTTIALQEILLDILSFIRPGTISESEFRQFWSEFEWENKVAVFTSITSCKEFINHICSITHMRCLTPDELLDENANFLAANLYAQSVFGEAALCNVSVEKDPVTGKVTGSSRLRSKSQGVALALGDRITMKQKGPEV